LWFLNPTGRGDKEPAQLFPEEKHILLWTKIETCLILSFLFRVLVNTLSTLYGFLYLEWFWIIYPSWAKGYRQQILTKWWDYFLCFQPIDRKTHINIVCTVHDAKLSGCPLCLIYGARIVGYIDWNWKTQLVYGCDANTHNIRRKAPAPVKVEKVDISPCEV